MVFFCSFPFGLCLLFKVTFNLNWFLFMLSFENSTTFVFVYVNVVVFKGLFRREPFRPI